MSMRTKVIGRQPTDHGPYDPQFAYGKKFTVTLFDCGWESKHDNNTSAPATLNAQAGTITENTTDWKKVWGSYKQWLIDNGYQKMDASDVKDGNNTQHDINAAFANEIGSDSTPESIKGRVTNLEEAVGTGGSVDERIATEGAKHYLKSETYTKEEVNGMITTPDQGFVSVSATSETTAATDVLPATGEADTIYRVANWDGSQYDTSVYSEYSWNTSTNTYIKLSTKEVGIDDVPTVGSNNLVKSGGIKSSIDDVTGVIDVPYTVRKRSTNWNYSVQGLQGTQGQKATVKLIDPNNVVSGVTLYYGSSASGNYVYLDSNQSKDVVFPNDFTELTMFVAQDWVLLPNIGDTGNINIVFEYGEGTEYRLKKIEPYFPADATPTARSQKCVTSDGIFLETESAAIEVSDLEKSLLGELLYEEAFAMDFTDGPANKTFSNINIGNGETVYVLLEDIYGLFPQNDYIPIFLNDSTTVYISAFTSKIVKYTSPQAVTSLRLFGHKSWISGPIYSGKFKIKIFKDNGLDETVYRHDENLVNVNRESDVEGTFSKQVHLGNYSQYTNIPLSGSAGDNISIRIISTDGLFPNNTIDMPVCYGDTDNCQLCWTNQNNHYTAKYDFTHLRLFTDNDWYATGKTGGDIKIEVCIYNGQEDKIIVPPTIYHYNNYINMYYDNLFREGDMPEGCHIGFDDYVGIIQKKELNIKPTYTSNYNGKIRFNYKGVGTFFYSNESFSITKDFKVTQVADNSNIINVMFIGDSITGKNSGRYLDTIKTFFDNDNTTVNFIGTMQGGLGEGRGGWGADTYTHEASYNTYINAFWNNNAFDFSYYMQQNFPSGTVDVVFINLGINDLTRTLDLSTILTNYDTMVNSIKSYSASVKIVIGLPVLPAEYEHNTTGSGLSVYVKKLRMGLIEALMAHYGNTVYYAPFYLAVNVKKDYELEQQMFDGYSTVDVCTDPTHPTNVGLDKIANICIPIVKYLAGLLS